MARITPSTGTFDVEAFEDMEPYKVRLKAFKIEEKDHPQYGKQMRMEVTWELPDDPDNAPRDWMSLKLGISQQDGQVSKLRMLLNALAQQPKDAEIAWFDDATFEWSYDGETAYSKISEGQEVILRGESVMKKDGSGRAFKVKTYQSAVSRKRKARPANDEDDDQGSPAGVRRGGPRSGGDSDLEQRTHGKVQDVDPDEIPF